MPLPPGSPLFPYTTLFRSVRAAGVGGDVPADLRRLRGARVGREDEPALAHPPPQRRGGDRKSTRLNSSHVEISYAVFCLKKKTANQPDAASQVRFRAIAPF